MIIIGPKPPPDYDLTQQKLMETTNSDMKKGNISQTIADRYKSDSSRRRVITIEAPNGKSVKTDPSQLFATASS